MGKREDRQKLHHSCRARERTIEPQKWMHEILIKHAKEQIYVHTAEVNYFGNRNVFRLDLKDGRVGI